MKALLSVFHKDGIVEFARSLIELGFEIISSGGTATHLAASGVKVTDVAEISGLKPILRHRVATLVPQIHGGLLATLDMLDELQELGYPWIDLVCVDLYPLKQEIAREGSTLESVIEKTDIGGPTLLRSGAKGRRIVVGSPQDRARVLAWLQAGRPSEKEFVGRLAAKAEGIVADYALASARYLSLGNIDGMVGTQVVEAKGENGPQSPAGLFRIDHDDPLALDRFQMVEGSQLSSNNWCDVDRALQTITHIAAGYNLNFGQVPYIAVGIKHGNACGAAVSNDPLEAIKRMIGGDPRAIFGGTVITNFPIDAKHATFLRELRVEKTKRILDLVMAPEFSGSGCEILRRKEGRCRMLANPELGNLTVKSLDSTPRIRQVRGGFLRQGNYTYVLDLDSHSMVKFGKADEESLLLGWAVGCTSNSNTITLTRDRMLIGNGTGQMDRVGAAELAIKKAVTAGHETAGCVAYSDSFFPFRDGPDVLADAGVAAILSTSGSERDEEVRTACKERKVALYMIPDSIARGFYAH